MKRIITFILAAALLCPALVARADGAPTSECVSGLTARYSAGEDGYGSLNVEADVTGVSPDEYVAVTVYSDVVDVTDPPGETNRDPLTFRTFRASGVIADGKLAITLNYLTEKLTGVCVLCVQIPNRGENNDWVRVCVEAKLTADPDFEGGEPKTVDGLKVQSGFRTLDWNGFMTNGKDGTWYLDDFSVEPVK